MATLARLVLQVEANTASMTKSLKRAETRSRQFAKNVKQHSKLVGGAMAGMGVATLGFAALSIKSFAQTGDEIQKMALRTGIGTEAISELKFAAEQSGSSIEGLEKGIRTMASFIDDAANGLSTQTRALDALGVSVAQLQNQKPEQAFFTLANAVAEVPNELQRAALAQDVFGRAGTQLLPLLKQGAEGIAGLRQEARDLGIVFDQEAADKAAKFTDSMNTMSKSFDGVKFAIAEGILPVVNEIIDRVSEAVKSFREWRDANPALAGVLIKVGLALGAVSLAIGSVLLALPLLIAGITAAGIAFNVATAGIPLAIAAIVTGIALLILNWDRVSEFMQSRAGLIVGALFPMIGIPLLIAANFDTLREVARKTFNNIVDFINNMIQGFADFVNAIKGVAEAFGIKVGDIEFQLGRWRQGIIQVSNEHETFEGTATKSLGDVVTVYRKAAAKIEEITAVQIAVQEQAMADHFATIVGMADDGTGETSSAWLRYYQLLERFRREDLEDWKKTQKDLADSQFVPDGGGGGGNGGGGASGLNRFGNAILTSPFPTGVVADARAEQAARAVRRFQDEEGGGANAQGSSAPVLNVTVLVDGRRASAEVMLEERM